MMILYYLLLRTLHTTLRSCRWRKIGDAAAASIGQRQSASTIGCMDMAMASLIPAMLVHIGLTGIDRVHRLRPPLWLHLHHVRRASALAIFHCLRCGASRWCCTWRTLEQNHPRSASASGFVTIEDAYIIHVLHTYPAAGPTPIPVNGPDGR